MLSSGTKIGPYEVAALIGSGGMGEVYRARDTKLGRDVALKILPDLFAQDPERLARFQREAQVLASLNHPNIAAIYGLEESAGTRALVLELVEGPTLGDRLKDVGRTLSRLRSPEIEVSSGEARRSAGAKAAGPPKGLPVDEVLSIARQIAEALEAAHEKGVTHRDLKPANVKITPAGAVKVLDFGLAKMREADGGSAALSNSPTMLTAASMPGTILGTAAYMSPEQAKGRETDRKTDVWAFGCVLYELLTGHVVFEGETVGEILGAVFRAEPDWSRLPADTPSGIRRLLRRCLEKDRKRRLSDIADARLEVEDALAGGSEASAQAPAAVPVKRWSLPALTFAFLAVGLIVGVSVWATIRSVARNTAAPAVTRTLVEVAPAEQLLANLGDRNNQPSRTVMALSPDGRTVVFSAVRGGQQQLFARSLDQLEAAPIVGGEGANSPFFSPDGRSIGFWANGALKKVSLSGGPATTICETAAIFGASWGSDDLIIFGRGLADGLWQVSATGGSPKALTSVDATKGEVSHRLPQILPGSQAVMFTITRTSFPIWDDTQIAVQSLADGSRKVLVEGAADARYASSGHLVYARRGTLMAVPFDLQRLAVTGGAVSLLSNLMQAANMGNNSTDSGAGQFSVSDSGSLVYVPGGIYSFPDRSLVWASRNGVVEPVAAPPRAYIYPRLSPDGKQILTSTQGDRNVWVYDIARGTQVKLTVDGRNMAAIWTPDGKRVTFGSSTAGQENLFWKAVDGSGNAERLTTSEREQRVSSWSPDGQVLAFVQDGDILTLQLGENRQVRPLVQTRFAEAYPEFSPDGQWLAYSSNESGRPEVYVQPYPGPGPRVLISTDGGNSPSWRRDGRELFYLAPTVPASSPGTKMMGVPIALRPALTVGKPQVLFQSQSVPGGAASMRGYDVTPDGQRFLVLQNINIERPPIKPTQMILVQNWFDELKRNVPTTAR